MAAILDPPSWIFQLFRNARKSPNFISKHRKQYKDAKIAKILEEHSNGTFAGNIRLDVFLPVSLKKFWNDRNRSPLVTCMRFIKKKLLKITK